MFSFHHEYMNKLTESLLDTDVNNWELQKTEKNRSEINGTYITDIFHKNGVHFGVYKITYNYLQKISNAPKYFLTLEDFTHFVSNSQHVASNQKLFDVKNKISVLMNFGYNKFEFKNEESLCNILDAAFGENAQKRIKLLDALTQRYEANNWTDKVVSYTPYDGVIRCNFHSQYKPIMGKYKEMAWELIKDMRIHSNLNSDGCIFSFPHSVKFESISSRSNHEKLHIKEIIKNIEKEIEEVVKPVS